jgi:hypothetical protein
MNWRKTKRKKKKRKKKKSPSQKPQSPPSLNSNPLSQHNPHPRLKLLNPLPKNPNLQPNHLLLPPKPNKNNNKMMRILMILTNLTRMT